MAGAAKAAELAKKRTLTIIPDGLSWTAQAGFFSLPDLFRRHGLTVNDGKADLVVSGKEPGCGGATLITVNAACIHVIGSGDVFIQTFASMCHRFAFRWMEFSRNAFLIEIH